MTYFVTDIECDGPLTGVHSLRSIGSVAVKNNVVVSNYYVNVAPHFDSDPDTMNWWKQWPRARASLEENMKAPEVAIKEFREWISGFERPWVFVSDTTWFDYPWIIWYMKFYQNVLFLFNGQLCFTERADLLGIEIPIEYPSMPHNALSDAQAMAKQFIHFNKRAR